MTLSMFTVHIDSMTYGGRGVGRRRDGKVVFVPLVVPGEIVRVSLEREHKGYIEARMEDLVEASPWRVIPACPFFHDCGGCDWQHIAYSQQVFLKHAVMMEQLEGKGVDVSMMKDPEPSPKATGYRCHTTIRCSPADGYRLGFFKRKSHALVPVESCLILNERCQYIFENILNILRKSPLVGLETLEIHAPSEEVLVRAFLQGTPGKEYLDRLGHMHRTLGLKGLSCLFSGSHNREYVFGDMFCSYELCLRERRIALASSFGSFIQANQEVNRALVTEVLAGISGARTLLDLFSGSGNFGIPLSLSVGRVMAVEKDPELVKAGRIFARKNGCTGIQFIKEDVVRALKRLTLDGLSFDAVVLDPPREGAREAVQVLVDMKIDRVVYVSCNPSTLARDLVLLVKGGFSVKSVRVFDMFPQTYHIESVTVLERNGL
ncbi:MAG TPA: class I SAM-dependent RNA methyltransferase [Desulfomonilia bacterium]|nr:class I SAM-dependent RNA methyltransferase [Desulfomonilia bacterium]